MTSTSSLWDGILDLAQHVEAEAKREKAENAAADAEARRKAPRTLASYLTVAGSSLARADLAVDIVYATRTGLITSTCAGCGNEERTSTNGYISDTPEQEQARVDRALPAARAWSQAHAETCRAMPSPDAA